jgi:hypothetical protein
MTKEYKKVVLIAGGIVTGICVHHICHNFSRMRSATASNTSLNHLRQRQAEAESGATISTNKIAPKIP